MTSPARIALCAFSREADKPLSTNKISSLDLEDFIAAQMAKQRVRRLKHKAFPQAPNILSYPKRNQKYCVKINNHVHSNSVVMKKNAGRRMREKQEMRLRILDAAREQFLAGGEDAVTLRRVAERIEYSATTIYLHFPNKEALIRELCSADFATYSHAIQRALREVDPLTRLRKTATAYVDFGLLYPAHYRAMFMTTAGATLDHAEAELPSPTQTPGLSPERQIPPLSPYDFLHTAVFKALAAGCFKTQYRDVATIAQVIWGGLHGIVSLHLVRARYTSVTWRPAQTAIETMLDCLFGGLLNENVAEP